MVRSRLHVLLFTLVVAFSAVAAADVFAAPEAESASEVDGLLERFETLREKRGLRLDEIGALEEAAQTAVGEDRAALQNQALAFMLDDTRTLEEMWSIIEKLEAAEADASAQRKFLASIFPTISSTIPTLYDRHLAAYETLKERQADLEDPEALAALAPAIQRREQQLLQILDGSIDVLEIGDALGISTPFQRDWLAKRVLERARLAMSHVNQASALRDDVAARKAAGADVAALQPAEAAANVRFEASLATLKSVVDLMKRLELNDTVYRQLLIASTGEITVEAIDRHVVGDLLSNWALDLRESASANGARIAFQAVIFALIVILFVGLARFVRKIVGRAVEAPHLRFSELLKRMIVSLSSGLVLLIGFLIALSQLGIEVAPMLAGLGIAGFVIGFALQDTLGNFASGIMILIYRPYDVGDLIDCAGGVFGKVSHMSLVSTTILTIDNKTLIVPNSKIWGDVITNVTAQAIRRVDLEFGIGYADDIPHAEEVLWSIVKEHPKVLADPEPMVKVHSLGDSSVNLIVRPWVARDDYWDVYWDFTREVKLRFDREGVSIPFPQRDVHLYSSTHAASGSADPDPMQVGSTSDDAKDAPETSQDT